MNTISIETGLQTYKLNDKCEVQFNPSDANFLKSLYNAFESLAKMQEENSVGDGATAIFEVIENKEKEARDIIDNVFNVPVCEPLFGAVNVFARTKDGLPLWVNLFMAILDECDSATDGMDKKASARVDKYIAKYNKKYHR